MRAISTCLLTTIMFAPVCAAQDYLPWTIETAFPLSGFVGEPGGPGARIAVNPDNDRPVVAFLRNHGEPGDNLSVVHNYPFGAFDGWDVLLWSNPSSPLSISDIDMDFWSSPTVWKFGISLRNRLDDSLHFIETEMDPSTGSVLSGTDHLIQDAEGFDYGVGTSIRYDNSGVPHIASYVSSAFASDSLMYATRVSSGGNCGVGTQDSGKWSCLTIDAGTDVGRDPDLELDGTQRPVIAYTKPYGGVDIVFVGRPTNPGTGNCGAADWDCQYPDVMGGTYKQSKASVHYDRSSADTGLHVAFMHDDSVDGSNIWLRHARFVGDGSGNCGIGNEWVCEAVPLEAHGDAMELGTNASGKPVLAFHTAYLDEVAVVEYLGVSWAGNCGTSDMWICGALESDIGTATMGEWLDLAIDSRGAAQVAYSKLESGGYLYELKYAVPWLFRDNFELGTLDAWSSAAP